MERFDEVATLEVGGVRVYTFGVFVMLGMAAAAAMIGFLCWAKKTRRGTAATLTAASIVLGAAFSRVFFCLLSFEETGGIMPIARWFQITGGGWSMMGLVTGVLIAAAVTAKITRQKTAMVLDIAACALPVFMAVERIGEGWVPDFDYSRKLTTGFLNNTFLTFSDYDGFYLATWKLAAIVMLILIPVMVISMIVSTGDGETCVLFLLLFGSCSVILESLRYDHFMTVHTFVGLQHILAAVFLAIGVIYLAVKAPRRLRPLGTAAVISLFAAAGIALALEFALDRTTFNKLLIYAAYILVMAVPTTLAIALRAKERKPARG